MSRFGSTASIAWNENNSPGTFTGSLTIALNEGDMPQFPVDESRITDEVQYRTKSGKKWSYRNYDPKVAFTFNWTNLNESKRNELATMVRSIPIMSISSGGNNFGTFKLVPDSVTDLETSYELYDFSFDVEEE